jgi:hypothetical protein
MGAAEYTLVTSLANPVEIFFDEPFRRRRMDAMAFKASAFGNGFVNLLPLEGLNIVAGEA